MAWASGSEGTVLRTTDGGQHWQACEAPHDISDWATLDFRGIQAWDSATAIVMASGPGNKSRLYKTVDACATWELLFDNPDSPNGFFDSFWLNTLYGQGILLGDPVKGSFAVFTTDDGGKTWNRDRSRRAFHRRPGAGRVCRQQQFHCAERREVSARLCHGRKRRRGSVPALGRVASETSLADEASQAGRFRLVTGSIFRWPAVRKAPEPFRSATASRRVPRPSFFSGAMAADI